MKIVKFDVYYHCVDIEYDTLHNCDDGCYDEGICRCGEIENAYVSNISLNLEMFSIFENVKGRNCKVKLSEIDSYCADRLMRFYKVYDTKLYTVNICGGYYGEEIAGVSFDNAQSLVKYVQTMINMESDIEKVKFALLREYSFLLDQIKDTNTVSIEYIVPNTLFINNDYANRLKNANKSYEFISDNPIGIVYGGRLIDGYHRFSSSNKDIEQKYIVLS